MRSRTSSTGNWSCSRAPSSDPPWRETVDASLYLADYLESEIAAIERALRATVA